MAVARQAIGLAKRFGSEITVLRVLAPISNGIPGTFEASVGRLATRRRRAWAQMDNFVRAHSQHVRVRPLLCDGDPATEILRQAAQGGSELIMMPTHGFNVCRRLLLGSVAAKCLYEAVCPVWTGPHRSQASNLKAASLSHIVCAIALGSDGSRGLEWAAALAEASHSALTVLHLAPRADLPTDECCELPWRCHAFKDGSVVSSRFRLAELVSRQILVETGDVSKTVSVLCERLNGDLLVLDHSPPDGARLRNDAYEIIRASACSVLRL
jgi:nucleotide-binding universal stress UspA family protein